MLLINPFEVLASHEYGVASEPFAVLGPLASALTLEIPFIVLDLGKAPEETTLLCEPLVKPDHHLDKYLKPRRQKIHVVAERDEKKGE